jgi:hypothetical protein
MATTGQYPKSSLACLFFIFCAFFPLTAMSIHTAIPSPLLQSNPEDLPTTNWVATLNKTMHTGLCQDGTHWRKCYDMSAGECAELVQSLTIGCTTKMLDALPPTVTPTVASLAGQQVGFCVGELFYKLARERLKNTPECQKKP